MQVIFLDIDGVLNLGGAFRPGILERHLVARLNELAAIPHVRVVVTSLWRIRFEPDELEIIFRASGYTGPRLEALDVAEDRVQGILAWVQENHPDQFLILDDRDLGGFGPEFIRVDNSLGLSDDDVTRALRILRVML